MPALATSAWSRPSSSRKTWCRQVRFAIKLSGTWRNLIVAANQVYHARISFPVEAAGDDLGQLLNVVLGNISLKPLIRAESLDLPPSMLARFRGPRFGRAGTARVDRRGGTAALVHGAEADGSGCRPIWQNWPIALPWAAST